MHLYEKEYEKQFQEKDPYFNKVIIHLERVHKLTTAQTLGLDCLEKRITNISKKNQMPQREDIIQKQDEVIKVLTKKSPEENKDAEKPQSSMVGSDSNSDSEPGDSDSKKKPNIQFKDLFQNVEEDKFASSDDGSEKQKNQRLENFGSLKAPLMKQRSARS